MSAVVELRRYLVRPHTAQAYMQLCTANAPLRKSLAPLRLFALSETGTKLNTVSHFYFYPGGVVERAAGREHAQKNIEWKEFLEKSRQLVAEQHSTLYTESPLVQEFGLAGAERETVGGGNNSVYEVRNYQLKLGYDTVPRFYDLYGKGLPSKLAAIGSVDESSRSQLVTLLASEIGQLNNVLEVWRHTSLEGIEKSRVASRQANEWREAIGSIAELAVSFENSIWKPSSFSNWK